MLRLAVHVIDVDGNVDVGDVFAAAAAANDAPVHSGARAIDDWELRTVSCEEKLSNACKLPRLYTCEMACPCRVILLTLLSTTIFFDASLARLQ